LRLATVTQERPSPAGVKEPTYDVAIRKEFLLLVVYQGNFELKVVIESNYPQNPRREGSHR